jgi:hypothetical protein
MRSRPKGKSRRPKIPTLPEPPGTITGAVTAVNSLNHQKLMGRVVIAWAALESCMQAVIWEFLGLSMSDGRIITSRLDAAAMIPMLRALGLRNLIDDKIQDFLDLLVAIDEYRGDRNFIVHGTWILLNNIPAAMSLRQDAEPGKVVTETFPRERMYEIVHGIEQCRKKLLILEGGLRTSRDKLLRQHPRD